MEALQSVKSTLAKVFTVTLESQVASTNYGWCLESLPEGIVLAGQSNVAVNRSRVNQVFYFIPISVQKDVEIRFVLLCLHAPLKKEGKKEVVIRVSVNDYNEKAAGEQFVKYSENAAFYSECDDSYTLFAGSCACTNVKYGFPVATDYGFLQNPAVKYGFPADICVAYGFPVNPCMKYGFPVDPCVKYGFPVNDDCC